MRASIAQLRDGKAGHEQRRWASAIALLLITGGALMAPVEAQGMPRGWHAMAGIGVVMPLLRRADACKPDLVLLKA